jgi:hypothetical protein
MYIWVVGGSFEGDAADGLRESAKNKWSAIHLLLFMNIEL